MAIVKVGTYRNPPVDITDYEAIVSHLEAYTRQVGNQGMILTEWTNTTNAPKIAMGSYISHGGVLYVVDAEDYAISFPSVTNGDYYLIAIPLGATSLIITRITDPSYYTWNPIYNGLYNSTGHQLLPYKVTYIEGEWYKYKLLSPAYIGAGESVWVDYLGRYYGRELHVTGAISGASLNTGSGAMTFDQGVKTTDKPSFVGLNIAPGIAGSTYNIYTSPGGYIYTETNTTLPILKFIAPFSEHITFSCIGYITAAFKPVTIRLVMINNGITEVSSTTITETSFATYTLDLELEAGKYYAIQLLTSTGTGVVSTFSLKSGVPNSGVKQAIYTASLTYDIGW